MMPVPPDGSVDAPRRTTRGTPRPGTGASRLGQPQEDRPIQPSVPEIGGPRGPEPTRYGDWEKGGRCTDF